MGYTVLGVPAYTHKSRQDISMGMHVVRCSVECVPRVDPQLVFFSRAGRDTTGEVGLDITSVDYRNVVNELCYTTFMVSPLYA